MIASMAAFAIEDAFLKTVTKQLPVGQVLMMFGAGGLCVFAFMARRAGASIFQAQVLTKNMLFRAVFEFFGRLFYILAIALTPTLAPLLLRRVRAWPWAIPQGSCRQGKSCPQAPEINHEANAKDLAGPALDIQRVCWRYLSCS